MSTENLHEVRASVQTATDRANEQKVDFGNVYDQPDPRAYLCTLCALDYQIPQHAKPWFLRILQALRSTLGRERVTVLDVGCSYGINAALLRHDLDLDDLYRRYSAAADAGICSDAMIEHDRRFFKSRNVDPRLGIVGLDTASHAAHYGKRVGLLEAAITVDLEQERRASSEAALLAGIDAVISTGCVGYVTHRTFDRILAARSRPTPPWVASFVLRMFPYHNIASVLARHGLRTLKLEDETFVQRRFANDAEQAAVIAELHTRGIQVEDYESVGTLHTELFLSIPSSSMITAPFGHTWSVVAEP